MTQAYSKTNSKLRPSAGAELESVEVVDFPFSGAVLELSINIINIIITVGKNGCKRHTGTTFTPFASSCDILRRHLLITEKGGKAKKFPVQVIHNASTFATPVSGLHET